MGKYLSRAITAYHSTFGRLCLYELDKPIAVHAHRESHLVFHVTGPEAGCHVEGQYRKLSPDAAVAVSPWQPHDFDGGHLQQPVLLLVLYIDKDWFSERACAPDHDLRFGRADIELTDDVRSVVTRLASKLAADCPPNGIDAELHALAHDCHVISWAGNTDREPERRSDIVVTDSRIRKSLVILEDSLGHPVPLTTIAEQVGLSRAQFFRLFTRTTGVTPNVYLNTLRMEQALDRLVSTERAVKTIGFELGFASQPSFTRFFINHAGISPSLYRQAARTNRESTSAERGRTKSR